MRDEYSIHNIIQEGKECLSKNGIDSREARLLLAYSMGISTDALIRENVCTSKQYELFLACIQKRVEGVPFAYITGEKCFMKLRFKMTSDTLIPREDTEILVQKALEEINHTEEVRKTLIKEKSYRKNKLRILDMCTGSGCIAISIAKYAPNCMVDACDISKEALKVAEENAIFHNVSVNWIHSDLFQNVYQQYDMILSNPPYVATEVMANLQKEVQKEPRIALDGGKDGLTFYRSISMEAKSYLKQNGYLIFEIGYDQGKMVESILHENGYKNISIMQDFGGNDRVVICQYNE